MNTVSNAMRDSFPLSYAGNYLMACAYDVPRGTTNAKGRPLAAINFPASAFYLANVGTATDPKTGNRFAGWYIAPGYGSVGNGTGRWEQGKRHQGGRNWTFCDGHAKYYKDPASFTDDAGKPLSTSATIYLYQQKGIYPYPETTGSEYAPPPTYTRFQ